MQTAFYILALSYIKNFAKEERRGCMTSVGDQDVRFGLRIWRQVSSNKY